MAEISVVQMIPYDEAEGKPCSLGGMGGFFDRGMRWEQILECYSAGGREYCEAFRKYILENCLKRGGDFHQEDAAGAPLFSDGTVGSFSYRGWGDFLAGVWSEAENKDYTYMDFYMDCLVEE